MKGPVRLGELLRAYATRLGVRGALEEAEVLAAWQALYGSERDVRAEAFRAGTLILAARNAAAAQEASLQRAAFQAELNRQLGRALVRAIRVVQGTRD
ncbi:MAG: DciA family protein [Armatimonadota bacterium]|nr:DciA family protein [Armatimonadota bacterium]MDR7438893.1 DciA family protein [Armatimonadota bacterium]MDR7562433.1 DciA family protein [Armatimonadota bacterium]MDR7568854.1 DciA family protein [Armatimonadota bacterium]MDR7601513.1 DciA family protein [Armatimonadota bacterium]